MGTVGSTPTVADCALTADNDHESLNIRALPTNPTGPTLVYEDNLSDKSDHMSGALTLESMFNHGAHL